jgi:hypothetical protein
MSEKNQMRAPPPTRPLLIISEPGTSSQRLALLLSNLSLL